VSMASSTKLHIKWTPSIFIEKYGDHSCGPFVDCVTKRPNGAGLRLVVLCPFRQIQRRGRFPCPEKLKGIGHRQLMSRPRFRSCRMDFCREPCRFRDIASRTAYLTFRVPLSVGNAVRTRTLVRFYTPRDGYWSKYTNIGEIIRFQDVQWPPGVRPPTGQRRFQGF